MLTRTMYFRSLLLSIATVLTCFTQLCLAQEHFLVKEGRAEAVIVVGRASSPFYWWVGGELQRCLRELTGADLAMVNHDDLPAGKTRIVVGGPESNPLAADAQQKGLAQFPGLKPDGFILKTVELGDAPAILVAGRDETSTMYAAYELLERLGVVFQLTGDIIPQRLTDLKQPTLDVRMEPSLKYRGLHFRHMWMPWMGMADFHRMIDQMAKMKLNYLEFYWYVGGPWIEYSHQGEKRCIDDVYTKDSGYLTWHVTAGQFKASDVMIGRELFKQERVCMPEFASVQNQEEAYWVARQWLTEAIDYAHQRKIRVWLGKGDCPFVPPNLGRHSPLSKPDVAGLFGTAMPPGDPAGMEIWEAMLTSMIATYPKADGYWIWLAEVGATVTGDPASQKVLRQYDPVRFGASDSDMGLVHYGKELIERLKRRHSKAKVGLAVLNRANLFRTMDPLVPKDVPFQSMESGACWHKGTPVPMEHFDGMPGRETFLVPRLDDDMNEFAMQFNVALYEFDRVLTGSVQYQVSGIAPQTGKLRGLEQNARFIAEGTWNPSLTTDQFYESYLRSIFGNEALDEMLPAYHIFQENEKALEWWGLWNFCNYAPPVWTGIVKDFRADPLKREGVVWLDKRDGFVTAIVRLQDALGHLKQAEGKVLPGAKHELEYVIFKTESYILHLQTIMAIQEGGVAYNRVVKEKTEGNTEEALKWCDPCQASFLKARGLARKTAELLAANVEDPDEKYILFRYNVYVLAPIEALCEEAARWSSNVGKPTNR